MAITFYTEETSMPEIDHTVVSDWIKNELNLKQLFLGNISIIFCSNEYLLSINRHYLNHDYYTDVITFDYSSNKKISGDIFISTEMISHNAVKFNTELKNELLRVIIHGILHLCGFNDKTPKEKEVMTLQEDLSLSRIKY